MMQESRAGSSLVTASSGGWSQHSTSQRQSSRRVEVLELLSRRRELAHLVADARRENDLLRIQLERSAAALDTAGDSSDVSQALRKHAECVRRLHEEMRHNKMRERSTERKLKKKVGY